MLYIGNLGQAKLGKYFFLLPSSVFLKNYIFMHMFIVVSTLNVRYILSKIFSIQYHVVCMFMGLHYCVQTSL